MSEVHDTDIKLLLYDFFKKFPLRDNPTYDNDVDLFRAYIWLRGWKLVKS